MPDFSDELIQLCKSVSAKRPKTVIDHILQFGFITTEELKEKYGYNHPPRAVRDVREHGIPVETFRVTGADGRKIAAYRFGVLGAQQFRKSSGRTGLSKKIKDELIRKFGCKCAIYIEEIDEKELQIDHRVPYEVGGDDVALNSDDFMLLSSSANRAKSWSCESCQNWNHQKDRAVCVSCYWAYPENYTHIAMRQIRRIDLVWQGEEVAVYNQLKLQAKAIDKEVSLIIKEILQKEVLRKDQ